MTALADTSPARSAFAELRCTGDPRLRAQLIEQYASLAYLQARRFLRPSMPLDDLRQIAMIGLIKAVDRYDPDRGTTFPTFAVPTIVGEIKRQYRDRSWVVRPPRGVQESAAAVRHVVDELAQEHGRSPTVPEIARRSGLTIEAVIEGAVALGAHVKATMSPDLEEMTFAYRDGDLDRVEQRAVVSQLLARLPARDRAIVVMRFYESLPQAAIAARVGVSQMQVSRVLTKSLATLRALARPQADETEGVAS